MKTVVLFCLKVFPADSRLLDFSLPVVYCLLLICDIYIEIDIGTFGIGFCRFTLAITELVV